MKRKILSASLVVLTLSAQAQYCMTAGPSSTADSNLQSLSLTGASGSITFTGCPGVLGVQEYLTQTAFLNAGGNYTVNLQFGTCGGNYSGVGQAWIDFDQSGTFDASESIGTWSGLPPTSASVFNFTVPSGASNGQTRMRVTQFEGGTLPINPCQAFTWGSVTDFSIFISNGIDCSTYTGDSYASPRVVNTLPFSESHSTSVCYSNQNPVYSSPDVFYLVKTSGYSSIAVSLCGSSFDTFLSAYDTQGNVLVINDDYAACGTSSQFEVNTTGKDTVYLIVEGWGSANGNYNISINEGTLGLSDIQASGPKIYPNPAVDQLMISGISGAFQVLDLQGKVLYTFTSSDETYQLDVSSLKSGIYFIRYEGEKESGTLQFQKR